MIDNKRNLARTAAKDIQVSQQARPTTKTKKPASKVYGPSSHPARADKVGMNR